jgi:hypothetical protein
LKCRAFFRLKSLLFKGIRFAGGEAVNAPELTWSKMAVFFGFVSKDFGELGSLLRTYPHLRSKWPEGATRKLPGFSRLELTV